ncbi:hypothetical protein ACFPMF_02875 [Larkinella bovis]|uniref:Uncharacterized protein n=1 Tax=Larkinella bovis TaxID=683041 RepID=A0ABW0I805_9BACT
MKENYSSPNGTYTVLFDVFEVRMSHWLEVPRVVRVADQQPLFDLQGDVWSTSQVTWLTDSQLELQLRKYPGLVSCALLLDFHNGTGQASCGPARFEGTLNAVQSWVLSH